MLGQWQRSPRSGFLTQHSTSRTRRRSRRGAIAQPPPSAQAPPGNSCCRSIDKQLYPPPPGIEQPSTRRTMPPCQEGRNERRPMRSAGTSKACGLAAGNGLAVSAATNRTRLQIMAIAVWLIMAQPDTASRRQPCVRVHRVAGSRRASMARPAVARTAESEWPRTASNAPGSAHRSAHSGVPWLLHAIDPILTPPGARRSMTSRAPHRHRSLPS
jgi:hypothetical protein